MMKKDSVIKIICALLIFLFVYAAVSKLSDVSGFRADMFNQPLPSFLKPILVWSVPASELIIAGLLIPDKTRLAGLYASLALMMAFTFYTGFVLLHFFEYIPCSCGGIIKNLTWGQHLLLNLFFVFIALTGILKYPLAIKNFKNQQSL